MYTPYWTNEKQANAALSIYGKSAEYHIDNEHNERHQDAIISLFTKYAFTDKVRANANPVIEVLAIPGGKCILTYEIEVTMTGGSSFDMVEYKYPNTNETEVFSNVFDALCRMFQIQINIALLETLNIMGEEKRYFESKNS